jgi:glycosyltransferase involved in cell wall biosynthesis
MRPIRILHAVGAMNRGGVETWLMHVLHHIDREQFKMDFLVHTNEPADYDEEIRRLGARIFRCPNHRRPLYAGRLLKIINRYGPFDVVHSHVHYFSGYILSIARIAGTAVRIAHSHNDTSTVDSAAGPLRKGYTRIMGQLIATNCTCRLAASRLAANSLLGRNWQKDTRSRVLHYGIEVERFAKRYDAAEVRQEFGWSPGDIVFGHVGRFDPQKNHAFLIKIAAAIAERNPNARFLFVGDGPLRPAIEDQLHRAGITNRVVLTGVRADIPRLMLGAMDRFLFPSLFEGLGLVLVEAQAANLPCIISDVVPPEADVSPWLISRMSLQDPAEAWAEEALRPRREAPRSGLTLVDQSSFNIMRSSKELTDLYVASLLSTVKRFSASPA